MALRSRRDRVTNEPVLTVTGALTPRTRGRLLNKMHSLAARHRRPLTVDVSGMSYFDSVSLTMLLGAERVIERQLDCPVDIRGLDVAASRLTGLDTAQPASSGNTFATFCSR
jgi:anti-anti-sigma regulatory factor